jgi:hypothetical protein
LPPLKPVHILFKAEQVQIVVIRRILDQLTSLPACERRLPDSTSFGKRSAGQFVVVPNVSYFPWRHHAQVATNSFVSGILSFSIGKLEAALSTLTKRNYCRKLNGSIARTVRK